MTERVGVVGLGRIGAAMTATLRARGLDVTGFDLAAAARDRAAATGLAVLPCDDEAEAIEFADASGRVALMAYTQTKSVWAKTAATPAPGFGYAG